MDTRADGVELADIAAVYASIQVGRVQDLPRGLILNFFRSIARQLESEEELALLGQLVHILGDGQLTKRLTVRVDKFSASAREKITASGGKVEAR